MSKYGFLSVLETQLDKYFSYDFAMDWDKKNHAVEVSFVLEVGLPEGLELDGESTVALEEFVIFYNPDKSQFDPEDYLVAIPYAPKQGLSLEFLAYFAQYLQQTADQGMDALLDFLADENQEDFTMTWDATAFENGRAELEEKTWYGYPRY